MPPPRGPRSISARAVGADQRRRLLEALPRAVAEHGYEQTTVEHIVRLAQVRRNSFYEQFEDKRDCFGVAYEIAQERLRGVLIFQCYTHEGLAQKVGSALAAVLDLLAAKPELARLLCVEALAAGERIAIRHHEWLDCYGRMLRLASVGADASPPPAGIEPAIVGGVASRIRRVVLAGDAPRLAGLCPELARFVLSFYGSGEWPPGEPLALGAGSDSPQPQSPEPPPALEPV